VVLVALALAAIATSAQSKAFRVRFDPIFSLGFGSVVGLPLGQEVGWEGSAAVNVPDPACLIPNTASLDLTTLVCGAVTLTNADIAFYNTVTDATLATVSWPAPFPIASTPEFFSVNAAGLVSGMTLDVPLSGFVNIDGDLFGVSLSFGLGSVLPDPEIFGIPTLTLIAADEKPYTSGQTVDGKPCTEDGADVCKVTAVWSVPEPTTVAVVGAGLLFLGLVRRRRS
jgi:hypothetical protein